MSRKRMRELKANTIIVLNNEVDTKSCESVSSLNGRLLCTVAIPSSCCVGANVISGPLSKKMLLLSLFIIACLLDRSNSKSRQFHHRISGGDGYMHMIREPPTSTSSTEAANAAAYQHFIAPDKDTQARAQALASMILPTNNIDYYNSPYLYYTIGAPSTILAPERNRSFELPVSHSQHHNVYPSSSLDRSHFQAKQFHQQNLHPNSYTSQAGPNHWPWKRAQRQAHNEQLYYWRQQPLSLAGGEASLPANGFPVPMLPGSSSSLSSLSPSSWANKARQFGDNSIMIDRQPPTALLRLIKNGSSSYLNMPTHTTSLGKRNHSYSGNSNHFYHQNNQVQNQNQNHNLYQYQNHDRGGLSAANGVGGSQQNFTSLSPSNGLNNNHFNSLLNNEDTGFGNKQRGGHGQPTAPKLQTPMSRSSAAATSSLSQQQQQQLQQQQPPNNNSFNSNGLLSEKLNGALTSSSMANSKVPHDADSEMIATNNAPRCDKFTPDICVDDFEYPEQAIIDEIQKKRDVFELMYSEVKDNEPLVDGIPRDVEESYNYDYYYYGKTGQGSNMSQAASTSSSNVAAGHNRLTSPALPLLTPTSERAPPNVFARPGQTQARSSLSNPIGPSNFGDSPAAADDDDAPLLDSSLRSATAAAAGSSLTARAGSLAAAISASPSAAASLSTSSSSAAASIDGMDALIGATPQATNPVASAQSPPTTGYICPSEVMYGKPKLAKNKKGLWKVIVNAGEFTQTVRLEKCLFPNKKCNYVSAQSYESRCAQVHSYHRLLVFEKGRGFYIDTFRLPTGCNCYVSKRPFSAASSSASGALTSMSNKRESNTNSSPQESHSGANSESSNSESSANFGPGRSAGNGRLPALLGDSSPALGYAGSFSGTGGGGASNAGHRSQWDSSPSPQSARGLSSESMLSQTLWSILSGGGGGGNYSPLSGYGSYVGPDLTHNHQQNYEQASSDSIGNNGVGHQSAARPTGFDRPTAQREAYQSQSLILEHLSQNPSLAANISNSVLRQLIDVGQISSSGTSYAVVSSPAGANTAHVFPRT